MNLLALLSERKTSLTDRWLKIIFESYPPETANFLKKEKNRFDNPMGSQLSQGLLRIFDTLIQETDRERIIAALDEVIRIRALQNFSPSQALAFLFLLKTVIRTELAKEIGEPGLAAEVLELESRLDGMALLGFEVYMQRREKLYEIRVTEVRNRVSGFLRSKGMDVNSF